MERVIALILVFGVSVSYGLSGTFEGTSGKVVVDNGQVGIGEITGGSFGPGSFSIAGPDGVSHGLPAGAVQHGGPIIVNPPQGGVHQGNLPPQNGVNSWNGDQNTQVQPQRPQAKAGHRGKNKNNKRHRKRKNNKKCRDNPTDVEVTSNCTSNLKNGFSNPEFVQTTPSGGRSGQGGNFQGSGELGFQGGQGGGLQGGQGASFYPGAGGQGLQGSGFQSGQGGGFQGGQGGQRHQVVTLSPTHGSGFRGDQRGGIQGGQGGGFQGGQGGGFQGGHGGGFQGGQGGGFQGGQGGGFQGGQGGGFQGGQGGGFQGGRGGGFQGSHGGGFQGGQGAGFQGGQGVTIQPSQGGIHAYSTPANHGGSCCPGQRGSIQIGSITGGRFEKNPNLSNVVRGYKGNAHEEVSDESSYSAESAEEPEQWVWAV
ncbi:unnamed protein product [Chrysodeixis includens]|uniref:Uncharacterized protein n=1 Tax=Chrysodeixis includens TaxID=689277 RepID=A0A9P0BSX9_CHRIL|nr:unnamed protein product [Chrysodeixis includens]